MSKMPILPQTTRNGDKIFLLDSNIAITSFGKILHYNELGKLSDTPFEYPDEVIESTDRSVIKQNIIDLENIIIDFASIDLIHNKINNFESFSFVNENVVQYKDYKINLLTYEIAGRPREIDENLDEAIPQEDREKIHAILCAIYRVHIENYVAFDDVKEFFLQNYEM